MQRILVVATLASLLAACTDAPVAQPAGAMPTRGPAIDAGVPIVVSTNEPFLQARIEGDVLVLTGVDVDRRVLTVEELANNGDSRTIVARDATGSVAVRVRDVACEDSMSGAAFPLSAQLTVDGDGPHPGCARPASMPVPVPPA